MIRVATLDEIRRYGNAGARSRGLLPPIGGGSLPLANQFDCGQSNGTAISAANSSGGTGNSAFDVVNITGTSTIAFDGTHAHSASQSVKLTPDAASGTMDLKWTTSMGTLTEAWGRLYVYRTATPVSGHPPHVVRLFNGASQAGWVQMNATGPLNCTPSGGTGGANGTVNVTLNTWVRIEWHYIAGTTTGSLEAKLFNTADSATADDTITLSSANMLTQITEVWFGTQGDSVSQSAWWLDDVQVNSTGYPGPYVAPTAASTFSVSDPTESRLPGIH